MSIIAKIVVFVAWLIIISATPALIRFKFDNPFWKTLTMNMLYYLFGVYIGLLASGIIK